MRHSRCGRKERTAASDATTLDQVEKLVKYERNWISKQVFIQAHEGFRITEQSPDPTERGTQQFRFARI